VNIEGRMAVARSANDRMKQQARDRGGNVNANVNFLRSRFVFERLLSRVGAAGYGDRWMLKGGVLMLALTTDMHRSTSDIDFTLRTGTDGLEAVVSALQEICAASPPTEDGVTFEVDMITAKGLPRLIGEQRGNPTVRATVTATLHCERPIEHRFVVDATSAEMEHLPVMRSWAPTVRGFEPLDVPSCSWEVVVAEKLHAVMTGTERNPRLRDYADLVVLARSGHVDLGLAAEEVVRVFAARGDPTRFDLQAVGLGSAFAALRQKEWKGTLATTGYAQVVPAELSEAIEEVRSLAADIERAHASSLHASPPF
jgi:hypothetical protein